LASRLRRCATPRSYGITNIAPYAAAPAVGPAGDTYYNTGNKGLYISDGTAWNQILAGGGGGGATNLLTREDSSFEGGTVGSWSIANATIANATSQSMVGNHSLQVTGTSAASNWYGYPVQVPVTPGSTYQAVASFFPATTVRTMQVAMWWYDKTGAFINQPPSGTVLEVAGAWATATCTAVAPANAVTAAPIIAAPVTPVNEVHYVDNIAFFVSAGWTPGGGATGPAGPPGAAYVDVAATAPPRPHPRSTRPTACCGLTPAPRLPGRRT